MRSSNPALNRLAPAQTATNAYGESGWYAPGATGAPTAGPVVEAARSASMTVDDVTVRTIGLLVLLAAAGGIAWGVVPAQWQGAVLLVGVFGGLILGLVISFGRTTNPLLIAAYTVLQGAAVGLISKQYNDWYNGIVVQAVAATFAVFFVMLILYRFKVLRATPRFTKGLIGALIAAVVLMFGDLILSLFGVHTGLRQNGLVGILFSIAMIALGALTFILDFDAVEQGVRAQLPKRYAWYAAFGIVVGLIWVYLEILRLLGYARDR
ncbi:Bax inhibitor-1/YccA family protein [Hamadaea tsunoensis]|uniref:Bax inhibitor-1/YccA family protein n=1 Tax=Hamadaea tsunoensis TaxID=53368 RepID=UPI000424613D|nr:Bax inhibitor-1/YccA family protein [Hamadaea tsunoensis]